LELDLYTYRNREIDSMCNERVFFFVAEMREKERERQREREREKERERERERKVSTCSRGTHNSNQLGMSKVTSNTLQYNLPITL